MILVEKKCHSGNVISRRYYINDRRVESKKFYKTFLKLSQTHKYSMEKKYHKGKLQTTFKFGEDRPNV